ncbi:unnamed protein product [Miscanthus lutarioriparius]|uniref:Uncharacterized protein n=1 Tax=Miscanthus lutarioriparius TaxID=422564 RepID=A0A811NHB2_9POAL|nr:unnamed protein product [Miscanthus lutarioriparius]
MGSLGSLGEPQGGRRRPRFLCPISHDSGGADQIRPTATAAAPSPTSLHPHRWRHPPPSPQQQRPFNRSDEGHEVWQEKGEIAVIMGESDRARHRGFLMDGDKAKESTPDCASSAAEPNKKQEKRKRAYAELAVVVKESASAEWQREIDALYGYYKEVSGHQLNPKELSCNTNDSIIACLLEGSLSCAKLTDEIYKRMKLQDGVTESFCYGYRWSGG